MVLVRIYQRRLKSFPLEVNNFYGIFYLHIIYKYEIKLLYRVENENIKEKHKINDCIRVILGISTISHIIGIIFEKKLEDKGLS